MLLCKELTPAFSTCPHYVAVFELLNPYFSKSIFVFYQINVSFFPTKRIWPMKTPKRDPKKIPFFLGPLVLQFCSMPHEIILYIEYIYICVYICRYL